MEKKDKYLQIFNYLLEFSKIRSKTVRDIEREPQYSEIFWLSDIQNDNLFDSVLHPDYSDESEYWIQVKKPKEPIKPDFPKIPNKLESWIDKDSLLDEENGPNLHERIKAGKEYLELSDFPDIQELFDKYLNENWLDDLIEYNEKLDIYQQEYEFYKRLNETYKFFFKIHNKAQQFGEEYELLIGIGLLNFKENEDCHKIFRHILTQKVDVIFEYSKRESIMKVIPNIEADIQIETDSIADLFDQFDTTNIIEAEKNVQVFLNDNEIVQLFPDKKIEDALQIFADRIRQDGKYLNLIEKPKKTEVTPTLSFSPTLILRKRNTRSFTALYETIIDNIENEGKETDIPTIDDVIGVVSDRTDLKYNGKAQTLVTEDNTIYFPKEFNNEQAKIIDKAKRNSKVLVQGPPGTGKSHTIANLICHLLANGKKVLVTAYTQRALEVLKDKLPEEFQNLTVNLLSGDSSSINDLQASVNAINDELSRAELSKYRYEIQKLKRQLQQINETKAKKRHELLAIHEKETRKQYINDMYSGTLLEIAEQLEQDAQRYVWYQDTFMDVQNLEVLDDVNQFIQQVQYYQKVDCSEYEYELPDVERLLSVERLKIYKDKYNELVKYNKSKNDNTLISSQDYTELKKLLTQLLYIHRDIELINLSFKKDVIEDYWKNQQSKWIQKIQQSDKVFQKISEYNLEQIDRDIEITYLQDKSLKQLKYDAQILQNYLKEGNALSGFVFNLKKPILPSEIKERLYFIDNVLVNGSPCDEIQKFESVINDLELKQDFEELALIWDKSTDHTKFSYKRNFYTEIHKNTSKLLELLTNSTVLKAKIADISSIEINEYTVSVIEELISDTEYNQLLREIEKYKDDINKSKAILSGIKIHPIKEKIINSFENTDSQYYKCCLQELADIKKRYEKYAKYKKLESKIKNFFPELLILIYEGSFKENHIQELKEAIYYSHAQSEISRLLSNKYEDRLTSEIKNLELKEKEVLATLASKRAWTYLIGSLNSNPELTTHLNAFAAFSSKAKGKGKKALKFRKDVQKQMENCKESVPAWIMDLNKVADSISPKQGMYDYVIIDEASQLGPDAIFLMYIAKNVIIVGDDKQIAPQNVGVKTNEMQPYIEKYLKEIELKNCFQPEFSFFDFARVFCGDGMIVLREHFRCMPEIIEFSNKHFYLPDRKGLYPLKQYSENRLDPIKTVFCDTGFIEGRTSKIINRPEAELLAKTIAKLVKLEDYFYYDNNGNKKPKSFGVIVLQGNQQSALIQDLLLKEIGETEYHNRKIVCGNSASFQGDERDVMFLSLITANNHRRYALTKAEDERRFNVAVSRAKEQIWLFSSVQLEDLSNPNDLRYKLLDYFQNYSTRDYKKNQLISIPVDKKSESPPEQFRSWFEVEIYNELVKKGYKVIPNYKVIKGKYEIDLVPVLPNGTKIAVECDGDYWHGADNYDKDLQRQKALERCGWQFVRIKEWHYRLLKEQALEPLFNLLSDLLKQNKQHDYKEREPKELSAGSETDSIVSNSNFINKRRTNDKISHSIQYDKCNKESDHSIVSVSDIENKPTMLDIKTSNKTNLFNSKEFLVFTNKYNVYKLENSGFQTCREILSKISFDEREQPIYITGTTNYSGFLLTAFENGKIAKTFIESYRTKYNRKKLKNAYNSDCKLVFIEHIEDEIDLIAISTIDKIMLFNTGDINPKSSTKSSGVQVMKQKGNSKLKAIKKINQVEFRNLEYYRKNIPATGNYLLRHDRY